MHIISILLAWDCGLHSDHCFGVSLVARAWRRVEARLLSSCRWLPFLSHLHCFMSLLFLSCLSVVRCGRCVGCPLDPRRVWNRHWLSSREQEQEKSNEMRVNYLSCREDGW